MIAVRDTIAVLDSELQTESGEVARWCLACCAVSTLVLLWVVSYSYRFSVSFNRSGNFARRVETNYDRLSCNRGRILWCRQWAQPFDPDPHTAFGSLNFELMHLKPGLSAALLPSSSDATGRIAVFGFAHYRFHEDGPNAPYGTRSRTDEWQCPIALFVVVGCLPVAAMIRRFIRQRRRAGRGFAIVRQRAPKTSRL